MDIVMVRGDQLKIEIDVVDGVGDPFDMSGADIRYVVGALIDVTEDDDQVELIEMSTDVFSRVRLTIDTADFEEGRYRQECKIKTTDVGPATILSGTIFIEASLIGADV